MVRTYIPLYIVASTAGFAGHSYRGPLLPPCVPIILSSLQVCPAMRQRLSDTDREGRDGYCSWDSGAKSHHITNPLTLGPQCPHSPSYVWISRNYTCYWITINMRGWVDLYKRVSRPTGPDVLTLSMTALKCCSLLYLPSWSL